MKRQPQEDDAIDRRPVRTAEGRRIELRRVVDEHGRVIQEAVPLGRERRIRRRRERRTDG